MVAAHLQAGAAGQVHGRPVGGILGALQAGVAHLPQQLAQLKALAGGAHAGLDQGGEGLGGTAGHAVEGDLLGIHQLRTDAQQGVDAIGKGQGEDVVDAVAEFGHGEPPPPR